MATYPTAPYSPASKSAGQTITSAFFNDPDAEITAVETALLGTLQHDVTVASTKQFKVGTAPLAMTLLKASNGTTTSAVAENVDTVAISGLTAYDRLLVYVWGEAVTQQTAALTLYNNTDAVSIGNVILSPLAAGAFYSTAAVLFQAQNAATRVIMSAPRLSSLSSTMDTALLSATFTTAWTGAWTLALRQTGVTAGGTLRWSWSVFKVAGQ